MKQTFYCGNTTANLGVGNDVTYFPFAMQGYQSIRTGTLDTTTPFPLAGTVSHFRIGIPSALGADFVLNFTIAATNFAITILAGSTSATDTRSISIVAGNTIVIYTASGVTAGQEFFWSYEFEGSTAAKAIMQGFGLRSPAEAANPNFDLPFSNNRVNDVRGAATDGERALPMPINLTIEAFYLKLSSIDALSTFTASLYINGVEDAGTILTITNPATSANVTGLSIALTAGDTLSVKLSASDGGQSRGLAWGIRYAPASDGQSVLGGLITDNASNTLNATEYAPLLGSQKTWTATEADVKAFGSVTSSLNLLRVDLANAPGVGKTRTFFVRSNGSDTTLGGSITGATTTLGPVNSLVAFSVGDFIDLKHSPTTSGDANSGIIRWSAVQSDVDTSTFVPQAIIM